MDTFIPSLAFLNGMAVGALLVFGIPYFAHERREWREYEIQNSESVRKVADAYLKERIFIPGIRYYPEKVDSLREALYDAREDYARSKGWKHPEKYRNVNTH